MKKNIVLCIAFLHSTISCMQSTQEQYRAFIDAQIKKEMFVLHTEWNVVMGQILNKNISQFLKPGVDIDINMHINKGQNTLLHFIADGNHHYLPTEQILNNPKLNVNIKNELGNTPLHCTVFKINKHQKKTVIEGRLSTAKKLIKRDDIDPNIQNKEGKTPLLLALEYDRNDLVELFLSNKKTDPSIASKDEKAPLHYTAIYKFSNLFKTTISNPNVQDKYGNSPLHYARTSKAVTFLLNLSDINVNIKNNFGQTPLDYAQEGNYSEKESVIALLRQKVTLPPPEPSLEKPNEIIEKSSKNVPQSFVEKHKNALIIGSFFGIIATIFAYFHYNTNSSTQ